jgi:hypothetical protein
MRIRRGRAKGKGKRRMYGCAVIQVRGKFEWHRCGLVFVELGHGFKRNRADSVAG